MSYRSFLFDLPLNEIQRPVITCAQNGGGITLSGPSGFDAYEWSTGENGTEITVLETGTYQLWVNHGAGMLGSEPFLISDLNNACPLIGTNAPESFENQSVIGYYDLLGRQISEPVKGSVYVARYSNGQAKLLFWME